MKGPSVNPRGPHEPAIPATEPCSSGETAKDAPAMNPGPDNPIPKPSRVIAIVRSDRVSAIVINENAMIKTGMANLSSVKGLISNLWTIIACANNDAAPVLIIAIPKV